MDAEREEAAGVAPPLGTELDLSWSNPEHLVNDLRRFLKERLPDYMLPSAFVLLDDLPLTANGKVDRRALPEPVLSQSVTRKVFTAPQTELEGTIVAIWQEVLGQTRIGIDDNFFDLGGHSLAMIRVQSRLCEIFGQEISIVDLFRYSTIGALAGFLAQGRVTLRGHTSQAPLRKKAMKRQRELRQSHRAERKEKGQHGKP
jgi:acyl carrier protein